MLRKRDWGLLAAGLVAWLGLTACAGKGGQLPARPPQVLAAEATDQPAPYAAPTAARRTRGASTTASPRAEESGASAPADYESTWERPRLATGWGESLTSAVRESDFSRQNPTLPGAMVAFYYDDKRSVEFATGIRARAAHPARVPVRGGMLTVSVVDARGRALPALGSSAQHYLIGHHGERYALEISNNSPARFEVVASVDGLDVLDGGDAAYSKRGYLVAPWDTLLIEGWRDSADTVRAFRFGDVADSYAVGRDRGRDIGVIGVAIFEEEGFDWYRYDEPPRRYAPEPFPGRFAPPPHYSPGTPD